jgi:hypothetical protein
MFMGCRSSAADTSFLTGGVSGCQGKSIGLEVRILVRRLPMRQTTIVTGVGFPCILFIRKASNHKVDFP